MENNSTAADAPDDVGGGDDDDDDDDDDIDDAYNALRRRSLVRRRRRYLEARHVLASFVILAVEWIRTYFPIHAVATRLKRMHDSLNDRSSGESNRWGVCADGRGGGSAVALGRPSFDWGTAAAGDTAGNGRSSRFALRFEVKRRARPTPPPPPSISTPSTRPRVDTGRILTLLEGRKSSSSILFASDGTKAKAPMEILNSSRMMSRLRERGNKDDD
jgi:hypothetical protein